MSTLAEIKAALPGLSVADLSDLDGTVDFMLRVRPRRFTGRDAVRWSRTRKRLDEKEAEAFAADIEALTRAAARRRPDVPGGAETDGRGTLASDAASRLGGSLLSTRWGDAVPEPTIPKRSSNAVEP